MPNNKRKQPNRGKQRRSTAGFFIFLALFCVLIVVVVKNAQVEPKSAVDAFNPVAESPVASNKPATPTPQETTTNSLPDFNPMATDATTPELLISETGIMVDGQIVDSYSFKDKIDFGLPEDYTSVQGIVTFRGNNFRNSGSYGVADIVNKKFSDNHWTVQEGSLQSPNGTVWTGSGWVGQPLMMTWPKDVRAHMNMYDWAKNADTLTEVIYATMDGNIYFLDLATGEKTRNNLYLGYTFKGAGALDPRGYPIMYLGSGYNSAKGTSHAFIINLLDCSIMYEFGANDPFSLRGSLSFFDGSALVDAETDRLIYPGESGILYIMKLNTNYDEKTGTLSINPSEIVKWRYNGTRTTKNTYWLGMEDSAIIWRGHIIMSDNGGNLMCLDLNTLTLDWVQNVLDDTNCTPVLELENGHAYVYTSTSFHGGWRAPMSGTATIPIWKIDAETGAIIWQKDYICFTEDGVSGGTQGTLAIGKNKLSDLIYVPVARTPSAGTGKLVALNKRTGEVVWEKETLIYSWSSPVAVYDKDGNGYIVYCTAGGYIYLLDGLTGEVLDSLDVGGNVEASPAVYNSTIVVGTRSELIWGVNLT
ncbi:MAG: pyrrolo-quinoline quinone [Firmicutes bacterium HGW-Firmicutes-16]|nr:MAG: pyrrolo-quinoline quinone [Firmicutes bacterium HGW-Firmicutes-16]